MIRIDGFFLYSTGHQIHVLEKIRQDDPFDFWVIQLLIARNALESLLRQSVFRLRICQTAGNKLLDVVKVLSEDTKRTDPINVYEAWQVTSALTEFEHVLTAEPGMLNIYLVEKIRGYDTNDLIDAGWLLFPESLMTKVPEAALDINAATRAIAFELATAAGFHIHRAAESVLHRYYDAVTRGAARPAGRNIGDYLKAMKDKKVGDEKVMSALKDLKDLHRNPLIHPEESLDDVDAALALLGSAHAVVVMMLKAIPEPTPPAVAPAP